MKTFSQLAIGDLFLWQSATWRKIYPRQNVELRYAPAHNAVKVPDEPTVSGAEVSPTYATMAGWLVMVEPSDVAELSPTKAFDKMREEAQP